MTDAEPLSETSHELGEGPLWCPLSETLFWVDIHARKVHALERAGATDAAARRWDLPVRASALAVRESGGLVLATEQGLAALDLDSAAFEQIAAIETGRPGNRSNEGKCDRRGRFWVGTMDDAEEQVSGALYRIDTDASVARVLDDIGIANTLAWTADERQMYFADTWRREIYRFDFDPDNGEPTGRRVFTTVDPAKGNPDGSTIDSDGCLWTAIWGGSRLIRWSPEGRIDREIPLPVRQPTSCMFGGPRLDTLFVTSARIGLGPDVVRREPHNGKILALHPPGGATGLPEPRFGG